jgi:hypothetical protein
VDEEWVAADAEGEAAEGEGGERSRMTLLLLNLSNRTFEASPKKIAFVGGTRVAPHSRSRHLKCAA